jgi:hypothetical protein
VPCENRHWGSLFMFLTAASQFSGAKLGAKQTAQGAGTL